MIVFVVWLAKFQFTKAYDLYDVDFAGPVRGLTQGGEVYFNGIKVGEVTKLSLDRQRPNRVVARVRVSSDAPIRTDSVGSLEPLGVTGVNYIQITSGTLARPLLKDVTPEGYVPVVRTTRGPLDALFANGGDVVTRALEVLDRTNRLLSDQNLKELSGTLADVHALTSEARGQKQLLGDLDTTLKSLNATSERIGRLSADGDPLLNGDLRRTLANLDATITELKGTAVDVRGAVNGIAGPTGDFATTGLPQLSRAVISLQRMAEDLDRVVNEVEQNPRSLISKRPPKTLEVQP